MSSISDRKGATLQSWLAICIWAGCDETTVQWHRPFRSQLYPLIYLLFGHTMTDWPTTLYVVFLE